MAYKILLSFFLVFFSLSVAAQTLYSWKDANGTTVYGSQPPQGVEAKPVGTNTGNVVSQQPLTQEERSFLSERDNERQVKERQAAYKKQQEETAARLEKQRKEREEQMLIDRAIERNNQREMQRQRDPQYCAFGKC